MWPEAIFRANLQPHPMPACKSLVPLLGAACLLGCEQRQTASPSVSVWPVSASPLLVISDSAVPPGHEFNGISSARRLRDGSILLANAGAYELVLFDSTGQFARAIGRRGGGPGEYQGPIALFAWKADSLAVLDAGNYRWTILSSAFQPVRTEIAPSRNLPQPTWLYQGAIIYDGLTDSVPSWVVVTLDTLRGADPGFIRLTQARRDDVGALWIRNSTDDRNWNVYLAPGSPAGEVTLPRGFEPLHIGNDFVLGITRDSLGLETVSLLRLSRVGSPPPASPAVTASAFPDSTARRVLLNLMTAQEMYYSLHGRYADAVDSLSLTNPPPHRIFLLAGDRRHWTGIGVHPETGATCGVSVGLPAPVGWLDGTIHCGR